MLSYKRSFRTKYWWYDFKEPALLSKDASPVCFYSVLRACYFLMVGFCYTFVHARAHAHAHKHTLCLFPRLNVWRYDEAMRMFLSINPSISTWNFCTQTSILINFSPDTELSIKRQHKNNKFVCEQDYYYFMYIFPLNS